MSIEIIKENFQVEEIRGSSEIQSLVETEIYLNTNKPDIENIIWVDGRVEILNTKIIKDKLLVNGLIKFNIVYKTIEEENNINTIEANKDFKEEILIEGIKEDMMSSIKANIEYIEYEIGENKIELKTVINIFGEVEENRTLEIIKEIKGKEDLQTLKENIKYKQIYGRETSYANINETLELDDSKPSIEKVIKFSVESKELESAVVEDRIIVSGEAVVTMIYLGDNKINSIKEEIPFNHFIEIPGVRRDSKGEVKLEVVEGIYEVSEDDLGDLKIIDLEIKIKVYGKAYDEVSRDLIIDAYSTKDKIDLKIEDINIRENIEDIVYEENIAVDVEIDALEILEIQQYNNILDKRYLDDELIIEGILGLNIYYIDRISGEIANFKGHFPYKSTVPFNWRYSNIIIDVGTKLGDINYILKKDIMSVETNITHNIALSKDRKIQGIVNIEETGETIDKKDMASITIYIAQKGDILWDIAKRYNTTIDEILSSNNLDTGYEIDVGDKIIIEKKVDLDF